MLTTPERFYLIPHPCVLVLMLCCMVLTAAGCQSQSQVSQQSPAPSQQQQQQSSSQATTVTSSNGAPPTQNVSAQNSNTNIKTTATTFDTCSLLTRGEISSVQGDEITGTQAAPGNSNRLAISQCYYQAATPARSVSLEVTRRLAGQANSLSPKEFWEEMFKKSVRERARAAAAGKGEADRLASRSKEEEKKEGKLPQRVAGVGDEAFWVGNRAMGALYVLRGNTIIRISIGGVADQSERLEKTKTLAQLALKRLKD